MSNSPSWSPWHLDDLNATETDPALNYAHKLNELELLKEELLKEKETLRKRHDELLSEEIEKAKSQGFSEGYQEGLEKGYSEGKEKAQEENTVIQTELNEKFEKVINQFNELITNTSNLLPEKILIIALAASKTILGKSINDLQAQLSDKIMDELEKLPLAPKQLTLRINPNDWDHIEAGISKLFTQNNWKMIKDDDHVKGGFTIETDTQEIDATLETKWQEIITLSEGIFINDK